MRGYWCRFFLLKKKSTSYHDADDPRNGEGMGGDWKRDTLQTPLISPQGWRGIVRRSPTQRIKKIFNKALLRTKNRCSLRSGPLKSPTLPYLFNYFTIKAPTSLVILKDFSAFFLNEIYFKIFKNKQVSRGYSWIFYFLLKIKRMVLTTRLSKGERGDKN